MEKVPHEKEMKNRKMNIIFASSAAQQKIHQADQQISKRQKYLALSHVRTQQ